MLLRFTSSDPNGNTDLVVAAANGRPLDLSKYEIEIIQSPLASFAEEFRQNILDHGITSFFLRQTLTEAIVPKGSPSTDVLTILHAYLSGIPVKDELIVVDPYFFSKTDDPGAYAGLVVDVLRPFLTKLRRVHVVTGSGPKKYNQNTQQAVVQALAEASTTCTLSAATSDDYHDRFWISANRSKGILTGTSLNGLGRRYALVDRLQEADVNDIVMSLGAAALLPP